jgi:4a-hydroxytetrahydrobiopterin dehydratase
LTKPLSQQHCRRPADWLSRLDKDEIPSLLGQLDGWAVDEAQQRLSKTLGFDNYYQTSAFVNAVVWLAHREDHHPEIHFGYRNCRIELSTHAVDGLSMNDFILAARIDRLLKD